MSIAAGVLKTINAPKPAGHFISGCHDPNKSSETITLAATLIALEAGTMLGQVTRGNQAVAAVLTAGNTGNGVFAAAPTADAGVDPGAYVLTVIEPAANGGTIEVTRPDGTQDGIARIGVAYNGSVNFTLNDGAADFVAGDTARITVTYAAGTGHYKPIDPAAVDGSQNFAGILYEGRPISNAVQKAVSVERDVVVNGNLITYAVAVDAAQKAAIEAQAMAKQVIIRR